MKEKTQRKPSGLGKILGALGFLAAARSIEKTRTPDAGKNLGGVGGSGIHVGNPIYFPPRKKYKGIDKENKRRNYLNKNKK